MKEIVKLFETSEEIKKYYAYRELLEKNINELTDEKFLELKKIIKNAIDLKEIDKFIEIFINEQNNNNKQCFSRVFVFSYREQEGKGEKDTLTINFNDELKWIFITKNIEYFDDLKDFIEKGEYTFRIDDDLKELKNRGLLNDEYLKDFGLNLKEFEALIQRLKEKGINNHKELLYEKIEFSSNFHEKYSCIENIDFFIDANKASSLILDIDSNFLDEKLHFIFERAKQDEKVILTTEDFEEVKSYLPTIFDVKVYDWIEELIKNGSFELTGDNEYKSEYAKMLISNYAKRNGIEFHLSDNESNEDLTQHSQQPKPKRRQ